MVRFKAPTKLSEALSEVRSQGIEIDYITREYESGGQTWTEGLYVGNQDELDATAITNEYWKNHEATTEDLVNASESSGSDSESSRTQELRDDYRMRLQQEMQQASSRRGCWRNNNCPEISITRMEVRGEAAKILKLRNSPRIERVNIHAELRGCLETLRSKKSYASLHSIKRIIAISIRASDEAGKRS